jgi:hypothetical protein
LPVAQLPYRDTGSLHVAYQDDEADVLREFAKIAPHAGYDCDGCLRLVPWNAAQRSSHKTWKDASGAPLN